MEKREKALWRYAIATLAFAELIVYLFFVHHPFIWSLIRAAFIVANLSITIELVYIKRKVDRFNAAEMAAA
jgi:uncharacterized membrane protein YjjB (DUF3815 family)